MSHQPWCHSYFDMALPFINEWKHQHPYYKKWTDDDRKAIDVRWVSEQTYQLNANAYIRIPNDEVELRAWLTRYWIDDEPGFAPSGTNTVLVVCEVPA